VDDRLQTTCNKSGKHDCRCEEEETSPLSPTIRSNGERKRRRSLPCGPADSPCVSSQPAPLPSLQENILQEGSIVEVMNNNRSATLQNRSENSDEVKTRNNLNSDHLERCFKIQLNIEEREGNLEKRCKRALTETPEIANTKYVEQSYNNTIKNSVNPGRGPNNSSEIISSIKSGGLLDNLNPFVPAWSFVSSWQNSNLNSKFQSFRSTKEIRFNDSERNYKPPIKSTSNHSSFDPYSQSNPFHESNPGPSTYKCVQRLENSMCTPTVHQSCFKNINKTIMTAQISSAQDALKDKKEDNIVKGIDQNKSSKSEMSQSIWKLSDEKDKKEEGGLLDWFSRVPGRVLNVAAVKSYVDSNKTKNENLKQSERPTKQSSTNEVKFKNCNLELSQREVDEVLAVLRARTPSGRKRTTVKNLRKRGDRLDRNSEDTAEKVLTKCAVENSVATNSGQVKFCEDYGRASCKIDRRTLEEQSNSLDRVYYDRNVYQPTYSKFIGNINNLNESEQSNLRKYTEVDTNKDHLQNVSTKADVLLGAILRTSKDRKNLSDVSSNGTRPKSATSIEGDSSDDDTRSSYLRKLNQQDQQGRHRTTVFSSNDEKFLPFAVNKRLYRFRQLFKKETDKEFAMMTEESSSSPEISPSPTPLPQRYNLTSYNNEQPSLHNSKNKAKRRIDFLDVTLEKERVARTRELSTKDAHQKPLIVHSTNTNDRGCGSMGLNNRQDHYDKSFVGMKDEELDKNEENAKKDIAIQKSNLTASIISQNGHSSSKILYNNNNKDSISEIVDDEAVDKNVPSVLEQEKFRRSLENAASMVFHSRTGLPLTSSPAPLRRGSCCFDYDSSLNSVSSKRKYEVLYICFKVIFLLK